MKDKIKVIVPAPSSYTYKVVFKTPEKDFSLYKKTLIRPGALLNNYIDNPPLNGEQEISIATARIIWDVLVKNKYEKDNSHIRLKTLDEFLLMSNDEQPLLIGQLFGNRLKP